MSYNLYTVKYSDTIRTLTDTTNDIKSTVEDVDSRLSNIESHGFAPTVHADSHASGGSDPVSPSSIGASSTTHKHTGGSDCPSIGTDSLADNAVTDTKIGNRTLNQSTTPSSSIGSLTSLLSGVINRITAITGKPYWYDNPATSLNSAASHISATAPHNGHINHSLCTSQNDFLVGSPSNNGFIKKTLAEVKAILGLGSAASSSTSDFAPAVHGNHVPTIQTASNSTFLRNDNSWQTITPANIGAVSSSLVSSTPVANNIVSIGADNSNGNGGFYRGTTAPTGTMVMNYSGYWVATRSYNPVFQDYAERFLKGDLSLEAGDIIALDPDSEEDAYIKSRGECDNLVCGVVSDDYGYCIGGENPQTDDERYVPVGLAGRVRVKVIGDIDKGDFIVPSEIPGVGKGSKTYIPGCTVGKSLQSHQGYTIDRIKMLVMNG